MRPDGIGRRRFLAICGGGVAGIWFAGSGFVRLSAEMVFAMSGACSFCGKKARELFGLAGILQRDARVCDECIALCFEILAEEAGIEPPAPAPVESAAEAACTFDEAAFDELLRRVAPGEVDASFLEELARAIRSGALDFPPAVRPPEGDFRCSFCDRHRDDVLKLIAGPTVFICDSCIGDAGALLMRHGWRPGV